MRRSLEVFEATAEGVEDLASVESQLEDEVQLLVGIGSREVDPQACGQIRVRMAVRVHVGDIVLVQLDCIYCPEVAVDCAGTVLELEVSGPNDVIAI